jgi:SAM-dependent methyltransferase
LRSEGRVPAFIGARALLITAVLSFALASPARAQFPFDVPYVPTPQVVVDEMLRLAAVEPADFVMDLGSGDGRILITAARVFGARGLGVELNESLVFQSEESARIAGVADRVKFAQQDLFKTDLAPATVITMYLIPTVNQRLRPALLELKAGTRIVSHDFDLEDWQPDRKITLRKNIFLWIVPAKTAGRWEMRLPVDGAERKMELEFRQKFQEIDGTVRLDGRISSIWEPRLSGERISFVLVDDRNRDREAGLYFEGRVSGNAMEGEFTRGVGKEAVKQPWRAVRSSP